MARSVFVRICDASTSLKKLNTMFIFVSSCQSRVSHLQERCPDAILSMPSFIEVVAIICIAWYCFIVLVCTIGCVQIFRYHSQPPQKSISASLPAAQVPHVTVIRPCKGIEPYLYECLASTLHQDYPKDKLTVFLCLSTREDIALHTLERIINDFPQHDVRILIEDEDALLQSRQLGPNPKIRNMSRAYREAPSDLVWILDCNIWISRGVCGRMVDRIHGFSTHGPQRPYKFVHHLPIAVDEPALRAFHDRPERHASSGALYGGRLDESFLSSSHAKMYVAINTVAVAPCVCGKSSMFRRSHLNALTNQDYSTQTRFGSGIDHLSEYICEDHIIGDLLWKSPVPSTMPDDAQHWRNHGLVYGDVALQPVSCMSVSSYIARRVRWLRVRKYTVILATLVEPGTESFVCSLMAAWGLTTSPLTVSVFGDSWTSMAVLWLASILGWILIDRAVYVLLQSNQKVEAGPQEDIKPIPPFAQRLRMRYWDTRRSVPVWLVAWFCREALAFPIWTWAVWGGTTVTWRDRKLWVGFDMKAHPLDTQEDSETDGQHRPLLDRQHSPATKARQD